VVNLTEEPDCPKCIEANVHKRKGTHFLDSFDTYVKDGCLHSHMKLCSVETPNGLCCNHIRKEIVATSIPPKHHLVEVPCGWSVKYVRKEER
jgi:hypothetical protein